MTVDPPEDAPSQVVDLYKLAVEMADRVSARRANSNAFFLTVQTTLVAVLGLGSNVLIKAPSWVSLIVSLAGVVLAASWWLQLRSYRDLNRAKFQVINAIEPQLPVQVFSDEWASLKKDPIPGWRKRYAELGTVERVIPIVFACLYLVLFVGRLVA